MITEEIKRNRYESYVYEMIYEWGDDAKYLSYEEFCEEEEEKYGWDDII